LNESIYISTGNFQSEELGVILEIALEQGFHNIELSTGIRITPDLPHLLDNLPLGMNFIIHNYFPPEPKDLVINLASANEDIRRNSIKFCKEAIDCCVKIKSCYYAVHSGFCIDPQPHQLGQNQSTLPRITKKQAKELFYDSLEQLLSYSKEKGITLCIENLVVELRNLIDGSNLLYLMTSPEDYKDFMSQSKLDEVRFLIDVGHLKVSSHSEKFDTEEFLDLLARRTSIVHISENNGIRDLHLPFDKNAWFLKILPSFKNTLFVLEAWRLSLREIRTCCSLIEEAIK